MAPMSEVLLPILLLIASCCLVIMTVALCLFVRDARRVFGRLDRLLEQGEQVGHLVGRLSQAAAAVVDQAAGWTNRLRTAIGFRGNGHRRSARAGAEPRRGGRARPRTGGNGQ